jgi:tetrapyrrole methylase family protein/MazG family protein
VVGLGPAGAGYLTTEARERMDGAGRTYVRTARHPAVDGLSGFVAFDHLYESAGTFAEVYAAIVEELVAAATAAAPEPITYAVPGSPLVAERTVELLRSDRRVDLTVIPGLSFLDLAWERLGIDPLGASVQLVDAEQFARAAVSSRGPFLVAQCWSAALLSDIKLTSCYEESPPAEVVLLHHLGLEDEQVARVGWWDLDRTLQPDHLTSIFIPEATPRAELGREMDRLESLVATLRARCPWDQVQTHASLMPHLLEESYEVLDALRELDAAERDEGDEGYEGVEGDTDAVAALEGHLREELGDLLFQIVIHARLSEETGQFTLADVARGVHDKLVHRHPHVFGDGSAATAHHVIANWEESKRQEKGRSSVTDGIPADLPALLLSTKLQRKALSIGISGLGPDEAERDVEKWVALLVQRESGTVAQPVEGPVEGAVEGPVEGPVEGVADEPLSLGDAETERLVGAALFEIASLSRRVHVDPELALRSRALRFREWVVGCEKAAPGFPDPHARTH